MKTLTLLFISVLSLQTEGYVIQVPTTSANVRTAPVGWIHIQKLLLPLFENVCEESTDPVVIRLNEEFKLDPSYGTYLKPEAINNLLNLKANKGLLPKGVIFTEYDIDHLNELRIIYEVLYYAKDFDTFLKAASWARQNVNCGLFVDAIYLAILNRRDTDKVAIPAPYEILPNYFIRKDYILKASSLIRGGTFTPSEYVRNEGNAYVLDVNYTATYDDDGDNKLAYFHEDVGLNSYYYLHKLKKLPWVTDFRNLHKNNYGEYIYYSIKQMMARYNLERIGETRARRGGGQDGESGISALNLNYPILPGVPLSNGLPELEGIDWDYINDFCYDPMLIYSNGDNFSQRKGNSNSNEILTMIKNVENNLPALVTHMRDGGYNKSEILNHLMEVLVTGEKSYENLAIKFLNGDQNISSVPSVLDHYMTTAREPIFWKLNKKIVDLVDSALQVLPSYTTNQLYFPGVEVQNIEVKKIITNFDNFEFDVTNALKSEGDDMKFKVKINQPRLNHKPFSFKISVLSQVAQKCLVKIFLGPKVLPGELVEKKNMFMLLDYFEYNLKIGSNVITRNAIDMKHISDDFISLETMHKNVLDAEFGVDTLTYKSIWSQIGFPSRLILPKGTPEGLPLHAFVFVAPYVKATANGPRNTWDLNLEAFSSPGYPLDLGIEIQTLFNLPNTLVKDIVITHKTESGIKKGSNYNSGSNNFGGYDSSYNSKTRQLSDIEYENPGKPLALSASPEFARKKFDYKSKKNQNGKKFDYSFKNRVKDEDVATRYLDIKDNTTNPENDKEEPDNMEIINNIYISPDLEREKAIDNKMDEDKIYYKISPENIYNTDVDFYSTSDLKDTMVDKNGDKEDFVIRPLRLLKSPHKRFSNIFNIVFTPVKPSDEELYE